MKKKRKSPIAKSLVSNSISAYYSAIEIHNKPTFNYRYEVVIILIINAWELLLKAYIYKFKKEIKLFHRDGTSKPFIECLSFVSSQLRKEFLLSQKNIELLYEYRNKIIHFYDQKLDILIYSLIAKNVKLYNTFLLKHFKRSLSDSSELVLLPIGFKKPFSPIDFISNESFNSESPKQVTEFIHKIFQASELILHEGVEESILADFKISLTHVNKTKNADIVAAVNNASKQQLNFSVSKQQKGYKISTDEDATPVTITKDKSISNGVLLHEELSEGIFEDINFVIDANQKICKSGLEFKLGEDIYFRIYAERNYALFNPSLYDMMVETSLSKFYVPNMYWMSKLSSLNLAKILHSSLETVKSPYINSILKLVILLGEEGMEWFCKKLEDKYKKISQKPGFYITFIKIYKTNKTKNLILRALKCSENKMVKLPVSNKSETVGNLLKNKVICSNELSKVCMEIFDGEKNYRVDSRTLDILAYGDIFINNSTDILQEIYKLEK